MNQESRERLQELVRDHSKVLKATVDEKFKSYADKDVGCKNKEEIALRNESMKRIAYQKM